MAFPVAGSAIQCSPGVSDVFADKPHQREGLSVKPCPSADGPSSREGLSVKHGPSSDEPSSREGLSVGKRFFTDNHTAFRTLSVGKRFPTDNSSNFQGLFSNRPTELGGQSRTVHRHAGICAKSVISMFRMTSKCRHKTLSRHLDAPRAGRMRANEEP